MDKETRKSESENLKNQVIEHFIKDNVFKILKKGTKASEKEATQHIDEFVKTLE